MLGSTKTDQATYTAGEAYSVVAGVADRLVREKLAEYIDFSVDDEPRPRARARSKKPWRDTIEPGDSYRWQITLNLPRFDKPVIQARFHPDADTWLDEERTAGVAEIGGDTSEPSEAQAKAIDYLAAHEPELYEKVLKAIAIYAQEFRADWEKNSPELAAKVLPRNAKAEDVVDRIAFAHIWLSPKSKDGVAYLELSGDCTWDADHGFCVVLHQDRIVDVSQQGYGWADKHA